MRHIVRRMVVESHIDVSGTLRGFYRYKERSINDK